MPEFSDDPDVERIVGLFRALLRVPNANLKEFITANPALLREDTHKYFAILADRLAVEIDDKQKLRLVAERMDLLRRCMESGIGQAVAFHSFDQAATHPHASTTSSEKYCDQCGRPLRGKARFCSSCGESVEGVVPAAAGAESRAVEQLFIDAEEGATAWGRSVFMNIFAGAASEVRCRFVARRVSGTTTEEVGSVPFFKEVNIPFDDMTGPLRRDAQDALNTLDQAIVARGWRRVSSAGPWYSRRYER